MGNIMGLFAIVPATLFLTISFFVLFAVRKLESPPLKAFGYVLAVLLWISSALVLGTGVYAMSSGRCPMMDMMQGKMPCMMMKGKMMKGQMPMMKGQMPMMGGGMQQMDNQAAGK
ncbi:MAG: hypothetical protein WC723_06985 [Candidatus Omnitrophota bacterium]